MKIKSIQLLTILLGNVRKQEIITKGTANFTGYIQPFVVSCPPFSALNGNPFGSKVRKSLYFIGYEELLKPQGADCTRINTFVTSKSKEMTLLSG